MIFFDWWIPFKSYASPSVYGGSGSMSGQYLFARHILRNDVPSGSILFDDLIPDIFSH